MSEKASVPFLKFKSEETGTLKLVFAKCLLKLSILIGEKNFAIFGETSEVSLPYSEEELVVIYGDLSNLKKLEVV